MRKGFLGSIAAVAAGAGAAWGQPPMPVAPAGDPPAPAAIAPAEGVVPANGVGRPVPPAPVIMPPLSVGPPGDPQGLGPVAGFGPPPGPMYPNPGPYAAPMFQPGPGGAGPGSGGPTGGAPHWWTQFDYLLYFAKSQPVRFPLLTTSAPTDRGLLGRPSTITLVGDEDLSYNPLSGFRVTAGFFGDCDRRYGFEASGFLLEEKSNVTDIETSPTGIPTLARPFIDSANVRAGTSLLIANPNFASGRVVVDTSNQTWGIEANALVNLYRSEPGCKCAWSVDFLAGYRFLQVEEDLNIASLSTLNAPATVNPIFVVGPGGVITQVGSALAPFSIPVGGVTVFAPGTINVRDEFKVTNRFNGGQVGLRTEARYGMFTFGATGKLAIGHMRERIDVFGVTTIANPPGSIQLGGSEFGGLLANASNIGTYNRDEFAVIPEANINVGINVTRCVTWFVGYNFLYIDNIARPGTQINPIVNSATVPFSPNYGTTNRPFVPRMLFAQDDFYVMGLNFGMMLRY